MIKKTALVLIKGYQKFLSPYLGSSCRFYPSCSEYAADAIDQHGVLCGGRLVFKRLLKCHPLYKKNGYDPVPETCNKK